MTHHEGLFLFESIECIFLQKYIFIYIWNFLITMIYQWTFAQTNIRIELSLINMFFLKVSIC